MTPHLRPLEARAHSRQKNVRQVRQGEYEMKDETSAKKRLAVDEVRSFATKILFIPLNEVIKPDQ
jgi:hypothetical protein